MRHTVLMSLVAALAFAGCGGGASESDWVADDGGGAPTTGPDGTAPAGRCEMKTVVKAPWCGLCRHICSGDCTVDAKGNCSRCRKPTTQADACVRAYLDCTECKRKHDEICALHENYQCCFPKKHMSKPVCGCGDSCPGPSCQKCQKAGGCRPRCTH